MTLEKLASIIMELNEKVDNGFKEVNFRIDKIENRINIIEQDIKELKKDVDLIKSYPTIKKEILII